MRTKLFSMKKLMRAMALGLATMLVVGSVNVMEVSAEGVSGLEYPKWNETTGTYQYNSGDIFGAATHVHFFGKNVTTTGVHTHGNIMAENAWIGEIGMRDGKISYPQEYKETSYIGTAIKEMNSTINGDLILGASDSIGYVSDGGVDKAKVNETLTAIDPTGDVHVETSTTKSVDIEGTLNQLKALSTSWSTLPKSSIASYDLKSDMNNRVINTNQTQDPNNNIVINIDYADWVYYSQYIQIKGLDSNPANSGIVIINVDMKGVQNADMTRGDMKVYDAQGNIYNNTEHGTAAFGSCRLVYNIIDTTATNNIYTGNLTFSNTVFGNILAPGASVTVGAINGNVMAETIVHTSQESHRLDIYPVFTATSGSTKVEYEEIRLLLQVVGKAETTNDVPSGTTYQLCTDVNGTTPVSSNFTGIEAVWNVTENKYEMIIDSETVNQAVSQGKIIPGNDYWLIKQDITTGWYNNNVIFKVNVGTDGTVKYAEAKADGTLTTTMDHSVLTDVLIRGAAPADIQDIILNLDLIGDTEADYADSAVSGTTYQLYSDKECTQLVGTPVAATWNDAQNTFQIVIDGSGLQTNTSYYIKKVDVTNGYNTNTNIYEAHVEKSGNIIYRETATGTFSGSYDANSKTDVLVKKNAPAKLEVIFSAPTETTDAEKEGVKYQIYTDSAATLTAGVSAKEVEKVGDSWIVTFDTADTNSLNKDTVYYIALSANGSDYKDEVPTKYQVKFDGTTGEASYRASNSDAWSTTVLTDKLIQNDELKLNVTLQGGTNTDANSGVKYDIYDSSDNKITTTPVEAVKNNTTGKYEVTFDSDFTTEKLNRDEEYYIKISSQPNDYTDTSVDKYWVKLDSATGDASYSEDTGANKNWVPDPLEDELVKTTTSSEPSSQPTNPPASGENNGGSNTGGQGSSSSANDGGTSGNGGSANNGGATNNGGNNTAGGNTNKGTTDGANANNSATDGANANNSATDGANANNSALTGSNAMNSAKTGEVPTIYIFAGFAALIAIAAGVYVFIKRKRA